jgi:hypothetical protein
MPPSIKPHKDRWIVCTESEQVYVGRYRQVEDLLDSAENCSGGRVPQGKAPIRRRWLPSRQAAYPCG